MSTMPDPALRPSRETTARREAAEADALLLARVAQGDRRAFEQLYVAYHRRLSRFLLRFADRYGAVEEIVNDTLYAVWKQAGEFRGQSQVSTWIIGIAYRRALKGLRHDDVIRRSEAAAVEDMQDHELPEEPREQRDWLAQGMAQLPLEQRMTLELAYFMGHSCEEIAEITGCPVNTVKTRMFNARRRLRELLPQLAEPVGGGAA